MRLALCMSACAAVALAGEPGARPFRSDVNLTLVNASVVDRNDRFVADLHPEDFQLLERGVAQRIASFSIEDAPLSVAIVWDVSASMEHVMPLARKALAAFLATANPEDEFSLVTVRDRPELRLAFARRAEDVLQTMDHTSAGGNTALLDAVYLAASTLRNGHNSRKAMLVVSDGDDNNSRYTELELRRLLQESETNLYAIGVGVRQPEMSPDGGPPERVGSEILTSLAEESGGRYFEAADPRELPKTMSRIDIRYQYVLGFKPLSADGKYHKVALKLAGRARVRHLHAYWRPGYYAPTELREARLSR